MTETMNTKIQFISDGAASRFLEAVRGGINFADLEGKIFSDILAQASALRARDSADDAGRSDGSRQASPALLAPSSCSSSGGAVNGKKALRELMQRIREEAREHYHNRQRIKRSSKASGEEYKAGGAGKTGLSEEDSTAEETQVSIEADAPVVAADNGVHQDETAALECDPEAKDSQSFDEAVALLFAAAGDPDETESVAAEEDSVICDTGNEDSCLDIAEAMQAEQTAFLMLQKIFWEKISASRAAKGEGQKPAEEVQANDAGKTAGMNQPENLIALDPLNGGFFSAHKNRNTMPWPETSDEESTARDFALTNGSGAEAPEFADDWDLSLFRHENTQAASATGAEKTATGGRFDFIEKFIAGTVRHTLSSAEASLHNAMNAAPGGESASGSVQSAADAGAITGTVRTEASSQAQLLSAASRPSGAYDFAGQLAASRAAKPQTAPVSTPVEQVAFHLIRQVKNGLQEMSLHLRPAELGRVEVKLSFSGENKVNGTVIVDNQATLELLLKDAGSLQRALQDAGLCADPGCLQFTLRGDGQAGQYGFGAGENGSFGHGAPQDQAFSGDNETGLAEDAEIETWYLTPNRVNLRV